MKNKELNPSDACLLIVDVQEKLYPLVENPCDILDKMLKLIKGCQIMRLPIVISEQYPKGLGKTIESIAEVAGSEAKYFSKTSFSCFKDPLLKKFLEESPLQQWIVAGIESHVCILQTARSLIEAGKEVVVANDATSSRSIYDFSTAIAELRDLGVRLSSVETILFELIGDASKPEFKALSALIKN